MGELRSMKPSEVAAPQTAPPGCDMVLRLKVMRLNSIVVQMICSLAESLVSPWFDARILKCLSRSLYRSLPVLFPSSARLPMVETIGDYRDGVVAGK